MAHLWSLDHSDNWIATLLDDEAFVVVNDQLRRAPDSSAASRFSSPLFKRLTDPPGGWALLTVSHAGARLNGAPVTLGLAVLTDRDEIRLPGGRALYFSTETLVRVEPFPELSARGMCPRCKQTLAIGSLAVRCPGCGLWHHATDDLPCWTYAPQCSGCTQDTSPDAGFRWTPEDL